MSVDAIGGTIVIGGSYLPIVRVQHDLTTGQVVEIGKGPPLHADPARLHPVTDLTDRLVATKKLRDWIGQQATRWWDAPFSGVSSAGNGTGTNYIASPEFHAIVRTGDVLSAHLCETGAGTTGTNDRVVYSNAPGLYLADPRLFFMRMGITGQAELQACRWGLHGGGSTTPPSSGRPAKGLWLEHDKAVDPTKIYYCCADGGTVTAADTGVTVVDGEVHDWFFGLVGSKAHAYAMDVQVAELCQLSTNLPSTPNARSARFFWQVTKRTSGVTSARGNLFNLCHAPLADGLAWPSIPS